LPEQQRPDSGGRTGGIDTAATTATLDVYLPPTLTKAFAASIDAGSNATLTFTFTNPATNHGANGHCSPTTHLPDSASG
jgi:hypothetical protein